MAGWPSTRASSRTVTRQHPAQHQRRVASSCVQCRVHSSDAGESLTRGGATRSLGSSDDAEGPGLVDVRAEGRAGVVDLLEQRPVARLTTNSPVARTLASVSLAPTEVKETIGGLAHATLKNECGARLPTPSASSEEIQAIGRGTTRAVSSR